MNLKGYRGGNWEGVRLYAPTPETAKTGDHAGSPLHQKRRRGRTISQNLFSVASSCFLSLARSLSKALVTEVLLLSMPQAALMFCLVVTVGGFQG